MRDQIDRASRSVETGLSVLLIVMMLAVVLQVVASALDINPLRVFDAPWPLLGRALTLNSLLDLQWHLLVIVGLLPAGLVWLRDAHVRVDFLYHRYGPRLQARVDLIGTLLFALPFFALILPASWAFMKRAWRSDEGSRNGGLEDLWLIKSVLPLGLALLALYVVVEVARLARDAR